MFTFLILNHMDFTLLDYKDNCLMNEASKLNYDEDKHLYISKQMEKAENELLSLKDKLKSIYEKYPMLDFQYVDPLKNFDPRRVIGPICENFKIKDLKDSVALETIAGVKLTKVIVDNEETGRLLLENGQLKERTTLIPLNKIKGYVIKDHVAKMARTLVGENNVSLAIDRVIFEDELRPAMEYAFGGSFICPSMDIARKVAFDPNIKTKCVTLEGDVYDSSGTLSGGSIGNRGLILKETSCLPKLKTTIAEKENEISYLKHEIQAMKNLKDKFFLRT